VRAAKDGKLVVFRAHSAAYKFVSSQGILNIDADLKSNLRQMTDVLAGDGLPF